VPLKSHLKFMQILVGVSKSGSTWKELEKYFLLISFQYKEIFHIRMNESSVEFTLVILQVGKRN
jgi:hypothetical protein